MGLPDRLASRLALRKKLVSVGGVVSPTGLTVAGLATSYEGLERRTCIFAQGHIHVLSTQRSDQGWVHPPPGIALSTKAGEEEIGAAVLAALEGSTYLEDGWEGWRERLRQVAAGKGQEKPGNPDDTPLKLANVESYREFGFPVAVHAEGAAGWGSSAVASFHMPPS